MTRIVIKKLVWDEYNTKHIKKHGVSVDEVEKVTKNIIIHKRAKKGRYLITGRVENRILSVAINRKGVGVYYPVTARDAAKKKRGEVFMKKKKFKFPDFNKMTYEEEAKWWDSHDWGEFWDELEDVDIVWELKKPRDETLIVRLQKEMKERLEKVARSRGLNLSTLARMWLLEKLRESYSK